MHANITLNTLILSTLLLVGLATTDSMAADQTFETTLSIPDGTTLEVDTNSGSITIRAGTGRDATITGKIRLSKASDRRNSAKADEIYQAMNDNPPVELADGRLRVGHIEDRSLRKRVSVSYEIVIPADTEVAADTGSGSVSISDIAAAVSADSGSGAIKLRNIGAAAEAHTGSGSIRAEGIAGAFKARSGSGSIVLSQTSPGDVDVSTGSGASKLTGVVGSLRASAGSGRIIVEGRQDGDWKLDSGSGLIDVTLPDDAAFSLYAESSSGNIDIEHPVMIEGRVDGKRIRGEVRGGGPLLRIDTGSGGIRVK